MYRLGDDGCEEAKRTTSDLKRGAGKRATNCIYTVYTTTSFRPVQIEKWSRSIRVKSGILTLDFGSVWLMSSSGGGGGSGSGDQSPAAARLYSRSRSQVDTAESLRFHTTDTRLAHGTISDIEKDDVVVVQTISYFFSIAQLTLVSQRVQEKPFSISKTEKPFFQRRQEIIRRVR